MRRPSGGAPRPDRGASAVEYGVFLAMVVAMVLGVSMVVAPTVDGTFSSAVVCMSAEGDATGC